MASLASTIALDRAELAAHDAPELGRVGGEDRGEGDRRVVRRRASSDGLEVRSPVMSGTSPDRTRISVASSGTASGAAPDGVAGAARLVLEREVGAVGERRRGWPRPAGE